jgi:phosphoribosylformimino-5-aminoimidazole carboxamide ribotide isomerase
MDDARFDLLPAIDVRDGRVVRLQQGDFERETAYDDDPSVAARRFIDDGAGWLHVVDLDGAREGAPRNGGVVQAIIEAAGDRARVEVAGGLRTDDAVDAAVAAGAARVVVGTAALRDPHFAARLVARHGTDRVAAAIDVRDGLALGEGWRAGSPGVTVDDALARLADAGVTTFQVTGIARDGLLEGPDVGLLERVVATGLGDVIASGGIATLEHLAAVRVLGCRGAIVGRALYEGTFTVRGALASLSA